MRSRPLDTDVAVWSTYRAILDSMGGPARLERALEMSESVREIRLDGILARNPGFTRRQAILRVIEEDYGVVLPEAR